MEVVKMKRTVMLLIVAGLVVGAAVLIFAGPGSRTWHRGPGMMYGYNDGYGPDRGYGYGCAGDYADEKLIPVEEGAKILTEFVGKNFVDAKVGEVFRSNMMMGSAYGAELTLADGTEAFVYVDGVTGEILSIMVDHEWGPGRDFQRIRTR